MGDLDLIPPYLHENVAGIQSPEYVGKLTALLQSRERVELATMGRVATTYDPKAQATARGKPALLVVTDQRLLAIYPQTKGLFGTKDPKPLVTHFTASNEGNVFNAGVLNLDASRVTVETCGDAPRGMKGAYVLWVLVTGDPDLGNLWAVNIRDNAISAGGADRRPNGL